MTDDGEATAGDARSGGAVAGDARSGEAVAGGDGGADSARLRRLVVDAMAARRPVDARERRALARGEALVASLGSPFDRDADPVHVTGSGVVTGRRGVLLLEHRKLHIWVQPGGHLEPGEAPWEAALRESEEETGLRLVLAPTHSERSGVPDLLHVDVHGSAGGHTHVDLRYALEAVGDDEPRPPSDESQEVAWFPWAAAIETADAGLAGLLRHLAPEADRPA